MDFNVMTGSALPKRFYLLEIVRGVAILKVILWHWHFLFYPYNPKGAGLVIDQQPLFDLLYIFYQPSSLALPFFFCASGFVFFWLYSTRVALRTITPGSFMIHRLSRLYPLHFVTLMVVAVGQQIHAGMTGSFFISQYNDLYHFILNLFFVSAWGLEKGFSFNGPVWVASIQVLMYIIFFIFCRLFYRNIFALFGMFILGCFIIPNYAVSMGVQYFFLGGIIFIAYRYILTTGDRWKISIWLPVATLLCWILTIVLANPHLHCVSGLLAVIPKKIVSVWPVAVLLPSTMLSLVLFETRNGPVGKRLSVMGDITYSMYLIHAPLQLWMVIVALKFRMDQELFRSTEVLILFFVVLIGLSLASRRFLEVPAQNYLRSRFGGVSE